MTIYGYARVSTDGQTLDDQVKQLRAAGAATLFREKVSGKSRENRPELRKAIGKLQAGDLLIVTRLDRFARSLRDLLNIVEEIKQAGAGFRSLADSDMIADPNSATGRLVLGVLGSVADFERSLILERTARGRQAALKAGVRFGPKPKLNDYQRREALKRIDEGKDSIRAIAKSYNVDHSMLSRLAAKQTTEPAIKRKPDATTAKAAKAFLALIDKTHHPVEALLYGSRARGDHKSDSDADIAVILKGRRGDRAAVLRDLSGLAFDVLLETGIHIQPLPLWQSELKRPETFSNPALIEAIKREGLRL